MRVTGRHGQTDWQTFDSTKSEPDSVRVTGRHGQTDWQNSQSEGVTELRGDVRGDGLGHSGESVAGLEGDEMDGKLSQY